MKNKIGILFYSNPDYCPPIINTIQILANEFDLVIICRNQDKPQFRCPNNVRLYRLGRFKTAREKELQTGFRKVIDYVVFIIRTIFYINFYRCRLIYSYDIHGFITGFITSRVIKQIPLIYHNLELAELEKVRGLSYLVKYLELRLASRADKVAFSDINRAKYFQRKAHLTEFPDIVINAPLRQDKLPPNRLDKILKENGFDDKIKVVLYQGTINEGQSLLEILRSMTLWPKDSILALSGYIFADFLERFKEEAKTLVLTSRINYLPFVPYRELFSYTVGAYIGLALFNSKDINRIFVAGASNKIFEYLSMGIPVVTNDSPYFREVLNSSFAYFTNPDSVEDIAKTINYALSDKEEHDRKSQAARQAHLNNFNYEAQFSPVLKYIQEII